MAIKIIPALLLATIAIVANVAFYYYSKKSPIAPIKYEFSPMQPSSVEEQDAPVRYLAKHGSVEVFKTPETFAPESYAVDAKGNLYASMRDGSIQRLYNFAINNDSMGTYEYELIVRTGSIATGDDGKKLPTLEQCRQDNDRLQPKCGTPLGLRASATDANKLLVADAYLGLLELDLTTRKLSVLVNRDDKGEPFKFTNSVVQSKRTGIIYFTDSSTKFYLNGYIDDVLEGTGNGRLFSFNPATRELRLLADSLYFANGIAISNEYALNDVKSSDETADGNADTDEFLFVAETTRARIRKYNTRTGEMSMLIEHLPCLPDNLKSGSTKLNKDKIWIGCSSFATPFVKWMMLNPWFRLILAKTPYYKRVFAFLRPVTAATLSVNINTGLVSEILVDPKKRFHSVAEAFEHPKEDRTLYIGTFHNHAIARIKY